MPKYELPVVTDLPPRGAPEARRRRVVIVTNPYMPTLEYMGALQAFDQANLFLGHSGRSDLGYKVEIVTARPGPLYARPGLNIAAEKSYALLRGYVDTLIFQASDDLDQCLNDERFIAWVARMSRRVRRIASICTGSFILAEAGVLDGRKGTTHWCAFSDFRKRYPRVELDPDPIYIKDGNVYTSAGSSSGMDLTIALIEEDWGTQLARRVAQGLVTYLRRPGNQAQFSVQVAPSYPEGTRMQQIQSYIWENLKDDLRIETLARKMSMSPRNFARRFTRQTGVSPGRYVEQCRLELARHYLEQNDRSLSEIADLCGYATHDGLRLAFTRHLGVSPREYRRRFGDRSASAVRAATD